MGGASEILPLIQRCELKKFDEFANRKPCSKAKDRYQNRKAASLSKDVIGSMHHAGRALAFGPSRRRLPKQRHLGRGGALERRAGCPRRTVVRLVKGGDKRVPRASRVDRLDLRCVDTPALFTRSRLGAGSAALARRPAGRAHKSRALGFARGSLRDLRLPLRWGTERGGSTSPPRPRAGTEPTPDRCWWACFHAPQWRQKRTTRGEGAKNE